MNRLNPLHEWDVSWQEALALQKMLGPRVSTQAPALFHVKYVAGVDVSHELYSPEIYAAVVVLDAQTKQLVETQSDFYKTTFPYRPGFLSFRELPAVLKAFEKIKTPVDLVMVDGQGIAHSRRLGIASHLGLWLDIPTIGCGKSILFGHSRPIEPDQITSPILSPRGEKLGFAVQTRKRARPMYISPGHKIDTTTAVQRVLEMCIGYRMPEPTRLAHIAANEARKAGY